MENYRNRIRTKTSVSSAVIMPIIIPDITLRLNTPNGIISGNVRDHSIYPRLVTAVNKNHCMDQFTKNQLTMLAIFPNKMLLHQFNIMGSISTRSVS